MWRKIILLLIMMGSENYASAQSIGMNFIGFYENSDTVNFSNYNSNYAVANDTLTIVVPNNEVWYLKLSILTLNFGWYNKGFLENNSIGSYCNCISLDGNILHNPLSSSFFMLTYESSPNANYPRSLNSMGSLSRLRKVSDYFDIRIPLFSGEHNLVRSFLLYSNSGSYSGNPIFEHKLILEKYQIVQ